MRLSECLGSPNSEFTYVWLDNTVRILLNRFCTGISFKKATMSVVKKEEDGGSEGDGSPAPEPKRLRVSPSPPRWSNAKGQQSPCHNPFHAHPVFASVSTPLYLMFGPHERDILSLHRESAIGYPLNDIEPVHTCCRTLS